MNIGGLIYRRCIAVYKMATINHSSLVFMALLVKFGMFCVLYTTCECVCTGIWLFSIMDSVEQVLPIDHSKAETV